MLKNARETIKMLKKANTATAKEHIKIITTALYDSRYGCPDLDVSHRVQKSAKTAKAALLSGIKDDLKPENEKNTHYFLILLKIWPKTAGEQELQDPTQVSTTDQTRPKRTNPEKQFQKSGKP